MSTISLTKLAADLRDKGRKVIIEETGGGTTTLFVGEPIDGEWYPVSVGPGRWERDEAVADVEGLYVGPDDDTGDHGFEIPAGATEETILPMIEQQLAGTREIDLRFNLTVPPNVTDEQLLAWLPSVLAQVTEPVYGHDASGNERTFPATVNGTDLWADCRLLTEGV